MNIKHDAAREAAVLVYEPSSLNITLSILAAEVLEALVAKHRALISAKKISNRREVDVDQRRITQLQGTWGGPAPDKPAGRNPPGFKSACWKLPIPNTRAHVIHDYAASTEHEALTHNRGGARANPDIDYLTAMNRITPL